MTYFRQMVATWHTDNTGNLYCEWRPLEEILDESGQDDVLLDDDDY